ncbi:MAG: UDP-N-acetylmuramoyl-L-alanyl-D-glutamate--2,6-diaminopimelate ligase [Rhodospirillaceae bacterium]|nr:UDP-N-acetylmuramoyl-L-alanyl-D-glutamate--2,6-diaminopimelate ligase [Rhodospirillaceae bacterium]MBT4589498.1 UDP-N-acetylmuramoyl-L-alanyl-D-glutamate--2,6-diaminopimelate ligase [Rhodospirillaceae bacterium]MBT7268232.1 UDP-N-acetylmuramoyl-L-alanyl-D-glutamate--2,6-diaminopimelate ligase [Rhodospirillaceae bacterium]
MRLADLLVGYEWKIMSGSDFVDADILGITADSRQVEPGFLFAALPGVNIDGRDFIADAIKAGAVAVLAPTDTSPDIIGDAPVSLVPDQNPRRRYAKMVGRFYQPQPEHVVAVTGTNGKSSVAEFTRQLWQSCGQAAASFGTLGLITPDKQESGSLTTPDPVDLHKPLAVLAVDGVEHVAVEASSHGLDQFRLDGVFINVAAFTNLSRDHLDYHETMEDYFQAKLRLFTDVLDREGVAVINSDDDRGDELTQILTKRRTEFLNYGRNANDIVLKNITAQPDGQRLALSVLGQDVEIALPLIGGFQAMNALCALGIVLADGADQAKSVAAMENLQGVRGRLEQAARLSNGAGIYVDYAHTPDALDHVLTALRPHTTNKLKVVFGCGGDRDQGKRPEMGAIAARLADEVIVTDDNPRSEAAAPIRAQIMAACPGATEIADRQAAIEAAVENLSDGDLLVIAGKGHEQGQIVGDQILPFDDVEVARQAAGGSA